MLNKAGLTRSDRAGIRLAVLGASTWLATFAFLFGEVR